MTTRVQETVFGVGRNMFSGAFGKVARRMQAPKDTALISYFPGNLPILLIVSHDGKRRPKDMAKRHNGCRVPGTQKCIWMRGCVFKDEKKCRASLISDTNTRAIADQIAGMMEQSTGMRPHILVNNLHRVHMDANRDIQEATMGVPKAISAYNQFHAWVRYARSVISTTCGKGLLLDIHGHQQNDFVMLGYAAPRGDFRKSDAELDSKESWSKRSTISFAVSKSKHRYSELLRGTSSFGHFLAEAGVKTVPSPGHPRPSEVRGAYFDGAAVVGKWGSKNNNKHMDAIQVELPASMRKGDGGSDEEVVKMTASALSTATLHFFREAYGRDAQGCR